MIHCTNKSKKILLQKIAKKHIEITAKLTDPKLSDPKLSGAFLNSVNSSFKSEKEEESLL